MRALSFAIAASVLSLMSSPPRAEELDPAEAGKEAREDLRALIDKQRKDKAAESAEPKPDDPKAQPTRRPATQPALAPSGGKLPKVCEGCGVK